MSTEQYMLFTAYVSAAIGVFFVLILLRNALPWLLK